MGTSVFTNFYETRPDAPRRGNSQLPTLHYRQPARARDRTDPDSAGRSVELHYSSATEAPHPTLPLAQDIAHMQRTLKQFAIAALFCAGTPLLSHANDISIYPALQCDQSRTGRQCPARDE
jgi:hypothetical protein